MMGAVWTIAEQREGELKAVSFELLAVGRPLADALATSLVSVVIGNGVDERSFGELIVG
jgi:electron transfer flavoprotein alpha subunit